MNEDEPPRKKGKMMIPEPRVKNYKLPGNRIIAICAHKGGVGKTTITINFIDALARSKYLVGNIDEIIVVDCDPQMNLTNHFLSRKEFDDHLRYLDETMETNLAEYKEVKMNNVRDVLNVEKIPKFDYILNDESRSIPVKLIRGSYELDDLSTQVAMESRTANQILSNRITSRIISLKKSTKSERKNKNTKRRLVVLDLSPSMNRLNQLFIKSADRIIMPVNCDLYSRLGLRLFHRIMRKELEDDAMLGLIYNRVQVYNADPTNPEQQVIDATFQAMRERFNTGVDLGHIENFGSMEAYQSKHKTLFDDVPGTNKNRLEEI